MCEYDLSQMLANGRNPNISFLVLGLFYIPIPFINCQYCIFDYIHDIGFTVACCCFDTRGLVNFLAMELMYFLALDEGSIQGFHERFEFLSLVFWAYRTSIQSNWEFTGRIGLPSSQIGNS
jgi:hypothetical protein